MPVACFAATMIPRPQTGYITSPLPPPRTPIETIFGLRERRNPEVVQMLRDLVSERRAASRPLPETVHAYVEGN